MGNTVVRAENVLVQVIMIKLTKENYLHWAATIKMGVEVVSSILVGR